MASNGRISLRREMQLAYAARAFKVYVDDRHVGSVRPGTTEQLEIAPGNHSVQVRIDFYKSEALDVFLPEGQSLELKCGAQGKHGLSMKMFTGSYLYLEHDSVSPVEKPTGLVLRRSVETKRSEEPMGTEERTVDNSRSSTKVSRRFSVSKEWAKAYTIDYEQAQSTSHEVNIGVDSSGLKSAAEQSLSKKYSITQESRELYQEEVEVEVPERTKIKISFHWKRLWQHGNLELEDESGAVVSVPYKVVTGITFDQTQSDEA